LPKRLVVIEDPEILASIPTSEKCETDSDLWVFFVAAGHHYQIDLLIFIDGDCTMHQELRLAQDLILILPTSSESADDLTSTSCRNYRNWGGVFRQHSDYQRAMREIVHLGALGMLINNRSRSYRIDDIALMYQLHDGDAGTGTIAHIPGLSNAAK
jgi:hypothetical protein